MTWKRFAVVGCLLALLAAQLSLSANEEETQPPPAPQRTEEPQKEEPPPPPPETEEPQKEEPPPPPPETEEPQKEEPPPPPPPETEEPQKEEPPPPPPPPAAEEMKEEEPPPPPPPPAAEEPKEEPKKEQPPQAPAEAGKKVPWWGDRFALYVEASLGGSSFDDLNSSIETAPGTFSANTFTLDDNAHGNITVGWMFPFDRGKALVSWTGYKEDSYTFAAMGERNSIRELGSDRALSTTFLLPYWEMSVSGGRLDAARTGWFWDPADDRPHGNEGPNGQPDADEVRFGKWVDANGDGKPAGSEIQFGMADLTVLRQAPDNLQNRLQTLDVLYQRDFGGRRVSGRWTGGLRHYRYQGNVPAAAWVLIGIGVAEGWTDGILNRVLVMSQDTSGMGPTGSLQVAAHFFRRRLTIYGRGRAAFLLVNLEVDSGIFNTLARDRTNNALFAAPARLQKSLDKSVWHVGAEVGVSLELAKGFRAEVAYNRTGYLDAVLIPTSISIPRILEEVPQGTVAIYNTQDILTDSWRVGFGYQF